MNFLFIQSFILSFHFAGNLIQTLMGSLRDDSGDEEEGGATGGGFSTSAPSHGLLNQDDLD